MAAQASSVSASCGEYSSTGDSQSYDVWETLGGLHSQSKVCLKSLLFMN